MKFLFVVLTLTLGFSSVCYADIQRWTDENGNVYFGDKVPPEHQDKAEVVTIKPLNTVAPDEAIRQQNTDAVNKYRQDAKNKEAISREQNVKKDTSTQTVPYEETREYCRDVFKKTKERTECFMRYEDRQNTNAK